MKHIILTLLIISSLFADDAIYEGDGATVFPISTDQIQMLHEKVKLTLTKRWFVEMTASYKNFGSDTTVQFGFPFKSILPDNSGKAPQRSFSGGTNYSDFFDPKFKAFVNGKSVPVTPRRSREHPEIKKINYPTVFTFEVHFNKDEIKTISHTYTVGGYSSAGGSYNFSYILLTGSLWKDKINEIEIEMILPEYKGFDFIYPQEHSWNFDTSSHQTVLSWNYKNIEPDFDIEVRDLSNWDGGLTLDQLIKISDRFIKKYGYPAIRYLRNLLFAHYGYPFKHPVIRATFYRTHRYSENDNYSIEMISTHHKNFLKKLEEKENEYNEASN